MADDAQSPTRFHIDEGPRAGEEFEVGRKHTIVGSDSDCDFALPDPKVSGEHMSLKTMDGHVEVHDLGSRTGTFVNGSKIPTTALIGPGDHVRIGSSVLTALETEVAAAEQPSTVEIPASKQEPTHRAKRLSRGWAAAFGVLLLLAIAAGTLMAGGVLSGGKKAPMSPAEIAQVDKASTVLVVSRGAPGSPIVELQGGGSDLLGGGSGWVYDASRGLIVTNAHVIVNGATVQVGYDQASLVDATIVGVDLPDDIAVLKVPPATLAGLKTLKRAQPTSVHQGDAAYALGYPGNSTTGTNFLKTPYQFTNGLISALSARATVNTDELGLSNNDNSGVLQSNLYQTTAAINPGNSGGPLVNNKGELLGMNVAASGSAQSQGYAIPIAKINSVVGSLAGGSSIGWPGFGAVAIPSELATQWSNGPQPPEIGRVRIVGGLILTSVAKDTPADQSGLGKLAADEAAAGHLLVLLEVNGQGVHDAQRYVNALKSIPSGESVELFFVAVDPLVGTFVFTSNDEPLTYAERITMP